MKMAHHDPGPVVDVYFRQEPGLAVPRPPPLMQHLREPLPAPAAVPQSPHTAAECDACAWAHTAALRARYRPEHERLRPARVLSVVTGASGPTWGINTSDNDEDNIESDKDEDDDGAIDVATALAEEEEEEEEGNEEEDDDLWVELLGPTPPCVRVDRRAGAAVRGVQSASLNRLVEAIAPASGAPDAELCAAIAATYPRFTTTHTLLRRLLRRYCVPSPVEQALCAAGATRTPFSTPFSTPTKSATNSRRGGVSPAAHATRLQRRACTFQNLHTDPFSDDEDEDGEKGGENNDDDDFYFNDENTLESYSEELEGVLGRMYGPEDGAAAISPAEQSVIQAGVVRAVARLITAHPRDFAPRDVRLVAVLARDALQRGLRAPVGVLLTVCAAQERALAASTIPRAPSSEPLQGLALPVRFPALTAPALRRLAEQFCLIDHALYSRVDPQELLCPRSAGSSNTNGGIAAMAARFNAVSVWTTSLMLGNTEPHYEEEDTPVQQPQQQQPKQGKQAVSETLARVAELLLKLATLLRDAGDLQGMHAVVTGLSRRCVAEALTAAFARRPAHHTRLARLRAIMAEDQQAATLRACAPPCVPFAGKYQCDLERIGASMPDHVEGRLVNVAKCTLLHRTATEMLRGRAASYPYTVEPSLHFYAQTLPESLPEAHIEAL